MSDQDDNDTGAKQVFCVSKEVVTAEILRQLSIKVIGEENFGQGAVFMITATGVKKLVQHGYQRVTETAGAYEGLISVHLTAPAGGIATATAAPAAVVPNTATAAAGQVTQAPAAPAVPEPPKHKVETRLWQSTGPDKGFEQKVAALAAELLIPATGKDIQIWVPHNDVVPPRAPPRDEGKFHVFIWGSGTPASGTEWRPAAKMWGIQVDCPDRGNFGAWEGGVPIVCQEGQEVGSVDKYNLFIYHDAVDKTTENELKILRKIFEAAAKTILNGCQIPVEARRDAYVELCGKRYAAVLKKAKDEHASLKSNVGEHQKQLIESIRRFRDADQILAMHQQLGRQEDSKAAFVREFDALLRVPLIEDILFRGTTFTAHTKDLSVVDPRTKLRHFLGKFTITINTEGGQMVVMNKTRQIDGHRSKMQAPHVFPDGNCCLGTLQSTIPDLVAKYEFSTLVQVMLSYLGEVNMLDGAGRLVHHWPLLNKDGSVENDEDRMKRIKEFEKTTAFSAPLREDRQDAIAAGVEAGDDNEDEDDT